MKKHRLPAAVLALAALGFTLGTCEFVIVGILPDIAAGLNVSLAAVGRLVSVFAACYAVGTPLLTALTGRMDRFRLLMGLMLLFLGFPWRRWRGCPSVQRCATLLVGGPPLA